MIPLETPEINEWKYAKYHCLQQFKQTKSLKFISMDNVISKTDSSFEIALQLQENWSSIALQIPEDISSQETQTWTLPEIN